MSPEEPKKGAVAPEEQVTTPAGEHSPGNGAAPPASGDSSSTESHVETEYTTGQSVSYTPTVDDSYGYYDDPYAYNPDTETKAVTQAGTAELPAPPPPPTPTEPSASEEDDGDDEGMLRMSFLEHLDELRVRIIRALAGLGIAFVASLFFAERLWLVVQEPAGHALTQLGFKPDLVQTSPMESFSIIWMKLPLLSAIFLASPWVLYQVWAFIAPGLYKKERRLAAPFVICSAGLFILGGLFAYFVAFRFGLTFLLGIGRDIHVIPLISISEYFNLFVNVMLGIGLVFELPVLIFFLTLLRIASPRFLFSHSRYAILLIVLLAAVVTPTPDVYNLMIFSVPMVALYFVGLFASYLLVLSRENKRFPWIVFLSAIGIPALLIAGALWIAVAKYGYTIVPSWPFLVR